MKFLINLVTESEVGQHVQEIACLERKEHRLEEVGLALREAKKLLGAIQRTMVEQQVEEYLETQRSCPHCGNCGKADCKQAVCEKAADAVDEEECPSGAANAHSGAR